MVGLMLVAMVIYIVSQDEAWRPGSNQVEQPVPAAAP
jgi:hypothetical protein